MGTTEEVALERLAAIGPTPAERARNAEIQRGIAATMADVVRERAYNPNQLTPNVVVRPAGAGPAREVGVPVRTPGWSEPTPLASPATDEAIRRIADHFAPHAAASPLREAEPDPKEALKATMARAQKVLDALKAEEGDG
jgi:hypothetical protein